MRFGADKPFDLVLMDFEFPFDVALLGETVLFPIAMTWNFEHWKRQALGCAVEKHPDS